MEATRHPEPDDAPPADARAREHAGIRWAARAAVAVAVGLLLARGVGPGVSFSGDLTMIHAGARVWLEGGDPYDFETLYDRWQAAGGGDERPREERWFVALYPPTTYAALAPLGALRWPAARVAWVLLSVASLVGVAWWAAAWLVTRGSPVAGDGRRLASLRSGPGPLGKGQAPWHGACLLLLAAWLSAGPVATTLEFGQLGLVVLGLVLFAVGTPRWRPPAWAAGAALALAGCVKPQLAGVFALGFVALGRWRELGWTLGAGLLVAAVAVLRLEAAGVPWAQGLRGNLHRFAGTGFADPSPANPAAWQMVNLEPLWRRLFPGGAGGAGGAVAAVLAAAGAAVAWRAVPRGLPLAERAEPIGANGPPGVPRKGRAPWHGADLTLWVTAVAAVVTLLIAYHRAYDAVLLAVPGVWAARGLLRGGGVAPALVLAGVAAFWPPLPELLNHLSHHTRLPRPADWPFWLETAVMHHRPAVLLGLLGALLAAGAAPERVP